MKAQAETGPLVWTFLLLTLGSLAYKEGLSAQITDGWWADKLEQNSQSVLPLLSLETWKEPEGIWYLFLKIISNFQAYEHKVWKG